MQSDLKLFIQEKIDLLFIILKNNVISVEDDKVINITDIISRSQFMLHKMIQFIEIDIGEELRGQIAQGHTFSRLPPCGICQYNPYQAQNLLVLYFLPNYSYENAVIDILKVFPDISLKDIRFTCVVSCHFSLKRVKSFNRLKSSLPHPVCIRVIDKSVLEYRLNNIAQSVMHNSVPEVRLADLPYLRVMDDEIHQGFWLVATQQKLRTKQKKVVFQILLKFDDIRL